jgi:hypothetical protein
MTREQFAEVHLHGSEQLSYQVPKTCNDGLTPQSPPQCWIANPHAPETCFQGTGPLITLRRATHRRSRNQTLGTGGLGAPVSGPATDDDLDARPWSGDRVDRRAAAGHGTAPLIGYLRIVTPVTAPSVNTHAPSADGSPSP